MEGGGDVVGPRELLFDSGLVRVGRFRCRPSHPRFHDSGPTRGHLLVFPRETVVITHAGGRPIVADPSRVMIYNRGQEYRRAPVSSAGDRSDWLALPGDLAHACVRAHAPGAGDPDRPFGDLAWAPGGARGYLAARLIFEHARREPAPDRLLVEEVALRLLDVTVAAGVAARRGLRPAATAGARRAQAELADAACTLLAQRLCEPLGLADVARALAVSPFHLARVFRARVGRSLHAFRTQVRLRVALERVLDGAELAPVAFDLGFSSHSHFTAAFHATYGVAPSALRRLPAGALSKILTA